MTASVVSSSSPVSGVGETPGRKAGWWLFLAGVLTLPWIAFRVGPVTLSDALFAVSALLILVGGRPPKPSSAMQIALGLTVIAVAISSISAVDPVESLLVGARIVYIFAVWQWVTRAVVDTPRALRAVIIVFVIGCGVSGLAGLAQVLLSIEIPNSTVVFGRAAGLQTHPNGQGGALAIGTAAALSLVAVRSTRTIGLVGLAAVVGGLLVSGSVSGMVAATIGTIVVLILARPSAGWIISATILAAVAWTAIARIDLFIPGAVSPLTRLLDTTGQGSGESTLLTRWLTVEDAWGQILDRGLGGVGLDVASGVTYDGETAAHSIVVLVLLQGGIVLLIAYAVAIGAALAGLRRPLPGDEVGRVAVPAMVVTALAFALTGPVLYERWFWLPLLLALAVGTARRGPEQTAHPRGVMS